MRLVPLLLACTACASHGMSRVRDPEGYPLPTSAILDADTNGSELHCPGGTSYLIVEPPPPYFTGNRVGTAHVAITDGPELCAKIVDADR